LSDLSLVSDSLHNRGKALNEMLEEELGDDFTDDIRDSWKVVFGAISTDLMKTVLAASKS